LDAFFRLVLGGVLLNNHNYESKKQNHRAAQSRDICRVHAEFTALIRNDTPVMLAYAYCAKCHDLGEESIRKIVAQQAKK
jgi:hypothetical protein